MPVIKIIAFSCPIYSLVTCYDCLVLVNLTRILMLDNFSLLKSFYVVKLIKQILLRNRRQS